MGRGGKDKGGNFTGFGPHVAFAYTPATKPVDKVVALQNKQTFTNFSVHVPACGGNLRVKNR